MVLYALLLRPVGFIFSTSLFLIFGSVILGERKWFLMLPIAIISTLFVWYLVQVVLGIYMRPLPAWIGI
jgi:putative tricarboxylic transport membrane protein